ncbi:hypothetical protein EIP86_002809 [Pleurotus ostreatoroseus]|nr:hypothetical protein EIP86_002809 [Pleurotus ostreatoroseus]
MAEVGRRLSVKLRDPAGAKCDLIIALTHSRIPNDIKLARALFALSPKGQKSKDIFSEHGVDLLLGGHDHVYWISKGVSHWDGFDLNTPQPDAADDQGDTLIIKSGTDYRDLSEIILVLQPTPTGSVRKRVIHAIKGKRHVTRGHTPENEALKAIVDHETATVKAALKEPVCITDVVLDNRSSEIRLHESVIGNWVADCLRPAYDEALAKLGHRKADGVIMCMGDFRGSETYMPGPLTFGDLQGILFYPDPTVVVELDANTLWDTLESGLSLWPAQEGRFPSLSGLRVTFDGRRPAGQRILGVWLLEDTKVGADGKPILVDKEEVLRTSTRSYLIICGEYMVKGGDGYDVLKGKKLIIAGENGQPKIALLLNKKISDKSEIQSADSGTKVGDIVGKVKVHIKTELPQSLLELPKVSLKDCLEFKLPPFSSPPGSPISPSDTGSLVNSPSLSSLSFLSANSPSSHEGTCPTCGQRLPPSAPSRDQLSNAGDHKQSPVQASKDTAQTLPGAFQSIAHGAKETAHDPMVGIRWIASRALFTAALAIADHEDVGLLDSYEQSRSRQLARLLRSANISVHLQMNLPMLKNSGDDALAVADKVDAKVDAAEVGAKRALPVIHPVVDGRLKNVATARAD